MVRPKTGSESGSSQSDGKKSRVRYPETRKAPSTTRASRQYAWSAHKWHDKEDGRPSKRKPFGAYDTLGVATTATKHEIEKAVRKLSLANHPDKTQHLSSQAQSAATVRMKEIVAAKQLLTDDAERKKYDAKLGLFVVEDDIESSTPRVRRHRDRQTLEEKEIAEAKNTFRRATPTRGGLSDVHKSKLKAAQKAAQLHVGQKVQFAPTSKTTVYRCGLQKGTIQSFQMANCNNRYTKLWVVIKRDGTSKDKRVSSVVLTTSDHVVPL